MQGRDSAPSANESGGAELQDAVIAGAKPEQALLLEELLCQGTLPLPPDDAQPGLTLCDSTSPSVVSSDASAAGAAVAHTGPLGDEQSKAECGVAVWRCRERWPASGGARTGGRGHHCAQSIRGA